MSSGEKIHQVLARKYRPQGFDELIGQPAVTQTLKNAFVAKRFHHAYLLTGPRGCGKTTTARILAKALNCVKGPTPEPCGECVSCREISLSSNLDVLEMDAASNTGVDDVRQVIIETVGLAPARDKYKVFIIDETHMLSHSAFNALLKTIEEPPAHVVFILATTEAHKIPAPITSRCQRFKFKPVAPEMLAEHLASIAKKEKINVEPEALQLLSRAAEGSLRDAISLLDQCRSVGEGKITLSSVQEMFGYVPQDLLQGAALALLNHDAKALAQWLKKIYEEGIEPSQFLKDLRTALEAVYLEKLGSDAKAEPSWSKALSSATAEGLGFLLKRLNRTMEEMRFGDSPRLALELGLFSALEAAHDLSAWVIRLEALESRLSAGGGGVALASVAAASAPLPAATPVSVATQQVSWESFVEAVSKEKMSLGSALEASLHQVRADGSWLISFSKAFDLESAQRSRSILEGTVKKLAGQEIKIEFALGKNANVTPTLDVIDPAIVEGPGGAPEGTQWKDLTDTAQVGGLSKAESVFGGKAKIIKKPK